MGASSPFSHFEIGARRTLAAQGASASRLPCRRLAVLTYAQVGLVPHRVQDVRHHEPEPSLGARLSDVLLPLAFVEPTERPGHLPGLLEDVLDQGSLTIVLDIQVEDALIQVHHANKLLAVGSPQPDPFHRLAPYDGISDTLRRARDGGRGPRPAPRRPCGGARRWRRSSTSRLPVGSSRDHGCSNAHGQPALTADGSAL